jgi:hypothetical protein
VADEAGLAAGSELAAGGAAVGDRVEVVAGEAAAVFFVLFRTILDCYSPL